MARSMYVHIPFCLKRCAYCDFVSMPYDPSKEISYIHALKMEIARCLVDTAPLQSLYIGGGTPTVISQEALEGLIGYIFDRLGLTGDAEVTVETNPGTSNVEKFRMLHSLGVNRLSIGVQSFNDRELMVLGRVHDPDEAEEAVVAARGAGFENIGIDLIYGIPGQDIDSWKRTLERAVGVDPSHISTYELTIEEGTVLYEHIKGGGLTPLEDDEIIEMYEYAIDYLSSQGFIHYEISNFALPGYQCRHNLNYWDRGEYYGVGLGAHSFISGWRYRNTDDLEEYVDALLTGRSPVKDSEYITGSREVSEAVFLGLRKTEGIRLDSFSRRYGVDLVECYRDEIRWLEDAGLVEIADGLLRLTRRGLRLSNEVFVRFM